MDFLKQLFYNLWYGKKRDGLFDEKDSRSYDLGASGITVTKEDLPIEQFRTFQPTLLDQFDSDSCVGFSGAYGSEATEGQVSSGAFLFAMSKKVMNRDWRSWGTSILGMCKAKCKVGACKKELWDYKRGKRDYYANYNNIPQEAHDDASKHKGQSYFEVRRQDGMDMYDTMRAILNKYREKRIVIHTGTNGHAWTLIGCGEDGNRLERVDSYGERTLHYGFAFITRATANSLFTPYVIFDMERKLAELLNLYNGKAIKTADTTECFLVKNGQKHHLKSEAVAWSHNTLLFDDNYVFVITQAEMDKIPEGEIAKFEDGENYPIIKRILEKTNNLELINED